MRICRRSRLCLSWTGQILIASNSSLLLIFSFLSICHFDGSWNFLSSSWGHWIAHEMHVFDITSESHGSFLMMCGLWVRLGMFLLQETQKSSDFGISRFGGCWHSKAGLFYSKCFEMTSWSGFAISINLRPIPVENKRPDHDDSPPNFSSRNTFVPVA